MDRCMNIGVDADDEYGVRVSCTCDHIPADVNRGCRGPSIKPKI